MTENFADVTAVQQSADGHYTAQIAEGWDIGGVPNGGFVLAIAGRAMAESVGRPPLSVTAHFLTPTHPGACSIQVQPVRVGKRMAVLTGRLEQDGREALRVLGTFGQSSGADPILVDGQPPELPPYEDCIAAASSAPPWPKIYDRLALRWRPGDEGFARAAPTGRAEIAGWFAFTDGAPRSPASAAGSEPSGTGGSAKNPSAARRSPASAAGSEPHGTGSSDKNPSAARVDAIGCLLAADAFAPPVFNIGVGPGWVPTLELTVHIRAVPVPGPLRCVFRTHFVQGGMLSEDGEMWDEAGVLVAQSRQLALVPRS